MKNWLKAALITATILLSACEQASYQTLAGEQGPVKDLHKSWLVINYWATWCTPCREEIPELNAFSQTFQDDVRVLAVNFDNLQGSELMAAATEMGIGFDSLLQDPAPVMGFARPQILPTTVIIAPGGEVKHILSGPQTEHSLAGAVTAEAAND